MASSWLTTLGLCQDAGMTEPQIVRRDAQPYVAVRGTVTMQTVGEIGYRLPEVFGWLGQRGIPPAGAPFFRYDLIDMERNLEIEAGVPLAAPVETDGEVIAGVLPAGRYVSTVYRGHPDGLADATTALLRWADERDLRWDVTETEQGERWGCRLEHYLTDPAEQPDMNQWETELAFRLAD
jgi:effector-binding domain-containing protein